MITSPVLYFGENSNTLKRTEPAKDNTKKTDIFVHDSYVDKNNKIKKSNVSDKIPSLQPPINPTIRSSRDIYIIKRIVCLFVCVSGSALAIFMDRFWNQGYLWTPHDPGMTRKI